VSSLQDKIKRFSTIVAYIEDGLLVVILLCMIVFAGTQIILRNLFDTGIIWADPFLRTLVLWVGLAGAVVATRMDKHIAIDVVARFMNEKARAGIRIFTDLVTSLVCFVITYHSVRFVVSEFDAGTTVFLVVPAWLTQLIMPFGFAIIALRYLIFSVKHAMKFFNAKTKP
jgi:C4-dicarboxylate transporter, DctQ subunit